MPARAPLRRAERLEARRLAVEQKVYWLDREIKVVEGKVSQGEANIAEGDKRIARLLSAVQKVADRDQHISASLSLWFLSSALAANLAALWALVSSKEIVGDPLFWSFLWFAAGIITSFAAGLARLIIANANWHTLIRVMSSPQSEPDGKSRKAIEGRAITILLAATTAAPLLSFMIGTGVVVAARLA